MKAKKSYGQHFLINESLAEKIAYSLHKEHPTKNVLEIGPGKGVLTKYLMRQDINLKVVEADRDMIAYLLTHYPDIEKAVIELDFLKLSMNKVFNGEPFYMIGNYPYNISSQIVFKMLNARHLIPEMVGMFQKEVADRIIAAPGSKIYGVVSALVQAFYEGEQIVKVSPGSFSPPPKVNSSVIRLVRKDNYHLSCDESLYRKVVKQTFNQRRKMMRNTLKSLVKDPDLLTKEIFMKRPEQISVSGFIDITNIIDESNSKFLKDESGNEN